MFYKFTMWFLRKFAEFRYLESFNEKLMQDVSTCSSKAYKLDLEVRELKEQLSKTDRNSKFWEHVYNEARTKLALESFELANTKEEFKKYQHEAHLIIPVLQRKKN